MPWRPPLFEDLPGRREVRPLRSLLASPDTPPVALFSPPHQSLPLTKIPATFSPALLERHRFAGRICGAFFFRSLPKFCHLSSVWSLFGCPRPCREVSPCYAPFWKPSRSRAAKRIVPSRDSADRFLLKSGDPREPVRRSRPLRSHYLFRPFPRVRRLNLWHPDGRNFPFHRIPFIFSPSSRAPFCGSPP